MARRWKATLQNPSPGRPYVLAAFDDLEVMEQTRRSLAQRFGALDYETGSLPAGDRASPYGLTGKRLLRILSFARAVGRDELVDMQKACLKVERRMQSGGRPLVELTPGYVTEFTVVGTSLLEDFHRIYLYGGIFAETLFYFERMSFRAFSNTPVHFRQKAIVTAFNDIRLIQQGPC